MHTHCGRKGIKLKRRQEREREARRSESEIQKKKKRSKVGGKNNFKLGLQLKGGVNINFINNWTGVPFFFLMSLMSASHSTKKSTRNKSLKLFFFESVIRDFVVDTS